MATQRSKEATAPAPVKDKKHPKTIPIKDKNGKQVGSTVSESAGYPEGTVAPKAIHQGAKGKAEEGEQEAAPAVKAKKTGSIQDEVTKFLTETKSNADAIAKTKKHEYFPTMNKKAWDKLVEQKDSLGGGLFRMRLGNMLRGARSKREKLAEKAAKAPKAAPAAKAGK